MSSGSDDENAADNARSGEVLHEVLEAESKNSSSEETSSSAASKVTCYEIPLDATVTIRRERTSGAPVGMGSETSSGASSVVRDFQSSEDIALQPSRATDIVSKEIPTWFWDTVFKHITKIDLPVEYLLDLYRNPSKYDLTDAELKIVTRRIYKTPSGASAAVGDFQGSEEIASQSSWVRDIVTKRIPADGLNKMDLKQTQLDIQTLLILALNYRDYNLTETQFGIVDRRINNYYTHGFTDFVVASGENIPRRSSASINVGHRNEEVAPQVEQGVDVPPQDVDVPPQDVPPQDVDVPPQDVPPQDVDVPPQEVPPQDVDVPLRDADVPLQALIKVNAFRRIWQQRHPWKSYYKEYACSLCLAHLVGIIALILIFLRFVPLPSPYPSNISICGGVLMLIRNTVMHILIPEGPPFLAEENGDPIYEIELVRRSDFRDRDVFRLQRSKCLAFYCCCCRRPR